ncbi:unnamed protein product [Auanema sp. JU1783]|nr:unnamed protein product [Auanema sp. JU1783]
MAATDTAKKSRNPYLDSDEDFLTDSDDEKKVDNIVQDIENDKLGDHVPNSRWAKVKCAVREWGETSSCHGIPHLSQANTVISMVIWSVILAFCAVGFVYLFSNTLMQYLRFEKLVRLNLDLKQTNFPSVTFCNINPYKMSKIRTIKELAALLSVYESAANGTLL